MTNFTDLPTTEFSYEDAAVQATEQRRDELLNELAELRRKADAAKERARKAQDKFERMVVMLATSKPDRVDWYNHPGVVDRKKLLKRGKISNMMLHRIMNRRAGK